MRQVGSKMKSEKREGRSRFAQSLGQDKASILVAGSGEMGYNGRKKKSPVMAGEGGKRDTRNRGGINAFCVAVGTPNWPSHREA